jgi:hypothetical protein
MQKLTTLQLVKKLSGLHKAHRFIPYTKEHILVPILSQVNPNHAPNPILEEAFNILLSILSSSKLSLYHRFPRQNLQTTLTAYTRVTCPNLISRTVSSQGTVPFNAFPSPYLHSQPVFFHQRATASFTQASHNSAYWIVRFGGKHKEDETAGTEYQMACSGSSLLYCYMHVLGPVCFIATCKFRGKYEI